MVENNSLTKRERRQLAKEERQQERVKSEAFKKIKKNVIIGVVLLIVGFLAFKLYKFVETPTSATGSNINNIVSDDWILGNKDAKVTLLEYSDFECPACKNFAPLLGRLHKDFPDNLRIIYRYFPLETIHKTAIPAAKAAEAAGKQGKFWEMHDLLFEKQDDWADKNNVKDIFITYAKDFGLDENKFSFDYDAKETADRVSRDETSAFQLRLNSTPTFYLDGVKLGNIAGYDDLKSRIEKEVAK